MRREFDEKVWQIVSSRPGGEEFYIIEIEFRASQHRLFSKNEDEK